MASTQELRTFAQRLSYTRAKSPAPSSGQRSVATSTNLIFAALAFTACEFPIVPPDDFGDSSSSDTGIGETSFGSETGSADADASTTTGDGDGDAGDGDGEPSGFWADVACLDTICVGRRSGAKTWVQVVHSSDLDVEPQSPIGGPCTPDQFPETRCIQAGPAPRCFGGDGEWFAPFTCSAEVGPLGWPMWMCGESLPIFVPPWDTAGCHDELATSCIAMAGSAGFEIWPDCYIQTLLP
jgi:hypothetical protein